MFEEGASSTFHPLRYGRVKLELTRLRALSEPSECKLSPPPTDTRNLHITRLPVSSEGIGYVIEGDRVDERGEEKVDHRNSHSLDGNSCESSALYTVKEIGNLSHVKIIKLLYFG
ncbi:hypothetical protein EVAR_413_1 [Eumeta japonica]|uniref:Uncharacterized protein n=1 Tax=Eumeta variegata TaxID=151549 RepID=A0A4C1SB51_EUMVA|nr:hypothetical protein EVAR_413_1 [Eumeta japonica]